MFVLSPPPVCAGGAAREDEQPKRAVRQILRAKAPMKSASMVRPTYFAPSTIVCKPFNFFSINAVDVLTHNFEGFLITGVPKPLVYLFDNIIDILIKSGLTKW